MNSFWNGFVGGLAAGLLTILLFGHHHHQPTPEDQLAAMAELRREQLTETDIMNETQIATALEEYAVDNAGNYPRDLKKLIPTYLHYIPCIPGSDPPTEYTYEHPASNPAWGEFVIKDDGTLDPTLDTLINADSRQRCTKLTCKYIVYGQAFGVAGLGPN
jgi:hypothetical protein